MVTHSQSERQVAGARSRWEGDRTVAYLWGEHDMATADGLTEFLIVAAAEDDDLVVDLSAVQFMDVSTISVIVGARSRMAESSRVLTVRSPSALMGRVFGSCGLEELIEPAEASRVEWPGRAGSALESWVAVPSRNPARSAEVRSVRREHQASRE